MGNEPYELNSMRGEHEHNRGEVVHIHDHVVLLLRINKLVRQSCCGPYGCESGIFLEVETLQPTVPGNR